MRCRYFLRETSFLMKFDFLDWAKYFHQKELA